MRLAIALITVAAAFGQAPIPSGLVRGVLVENDVRELVVRSTANTVYRYTTDRKTWIERDKERISAASLRPGELLEVVADRDLVPLRYARMVHVIEKPVRQRPRMSAGLFRLHRSSQPAPLDDLTLSGVVASKDGPRITLRTRFDGEKTIVLRQDTRCLAGGFEVDASAVVPNTRVFIRGGRNKEGEIEAYEVVWGPILEP